MNKIKKKLVLFALFLVLMSTNYAYAVPAEIESKTPTFITLKGEPISAKDKPVRIDGKLMIPLKPVLDAAGFTVNWNQKDTSIEMNKGTNYTKIKIGVNSYFYNKLSPFKLSSAPILKDNRTYVPIEFFHEILIMGIIIEGDYIEFLEGDYEGDYLVTHSGVINKIEKKDNKITYHLGQEDSIYLIVTTDEYTFHQKELQVGDVGNFICPPIMLAIYPGQVNAHIVY